MFSHVTLDVSVLAMLCCSMVVSSSIEWPDCPAAVLRFVTREDTPPLFYLPTLWLYLDGIFHSHRVNANAHPDFFNHKQRHWFLEMARTADTYDHIKLAYLSISYHVGKVNAQKAPMGLWVASSTSKAPLASC